MNTKIVLDRQASARVFDFGTNTVNEEALVTIKKGTTALSTVVLDVGASVNIAGDLNLIGNLNITGSIDEQSVTNLAVKDITIRTNKGGTTAGAAGAGLQVEGDSGSLIGAITFNSSSASKFTIGNGSTQKDIVDVSSTQTLTNKSISGSQITGNISGSAGTVTGVISVANGGTGLSTLTLNSILIGNGTSSPSFVAPGSTGNVLTSNGTSWTSSPNAAPSTSFKPTTIASGTQNGSNLNYTLTNSLTAGSELITLNGQVMTPGPSADYLLSGTTLTFVSAVPSSTDIIRVYGNW